MKKYILCILPIVMLAASFGTSADQMKTVLLSDGVLFKKEGEITFSDSAWTVTTDISFNQVERVFEALEDCLISSVVPVENKGSIKSTVYDDIINRANASLFELKISQRRFSVLRNNINESENKRANIYNDRSRNPLSWLFGVEKNEELQGLSFRLDNLSTGSSSIVHSLTDQATIVNETIWETRTNTKIMLTIAKSCGALNRSVKKLHHRIDDSDNIWTIHFQIEDAFRMVHEAIDWADQFTKDLSAGLDLVAKGKLPYSLFPFGQFRSVLENIRYNALRPLGLVLSPGLQQENNFWMVYEEARVYAALSGNGLRIFMHLPVYDLRRRYSLHRIIQLPRAVANGTLELTFSGLPDFLAVSWDHESFLELTFEEVRSCLSTRPIRVCSITKAMRKMHFGRACSIALFLHQSDSERIMRDCVPFLSRWTGPKAEYLGHNRWAVSSTQSTLLWVSCPSRTAIPTYTRRHLPKFAVFGLPTACSGYTDDLIFPASLTKNWITNDSKILTFEPLTNSYPYIFDARIDALYEKNPTLTLFRSIGKTLIQLEEEKQNRIHFEERAIRYQLEYWIVWVVLLAVFVVEFIFILCLHKKLEHLKRKINNPEISLNNQEGLQQRDLLTVNMVEARTKQLNSSV